MAERKLEVPLCMLCREELKREGRSVELVKRRTDTKITRSVCCNRRYGSVYYVSKAVYPHV